MIGEVGEKHFVYMSGITTLLYPFIIIMNGIDFFFIKTKKENGLHVNQINKENI